METHVERAKRLLSVANGIKEGSLPLNQTPTNEFVALVQQVYKGRINGGDDLFLENYGNLLIKGLENKDRDEVADVMTLLAYHVLVLKNNDVQLGKHKNKNYLLQSQVGYYKNLEKVKAWHEKNGYENKVPFEGRGVVYSAITGNYDDVRDPEYIDSKLDYILFTNNPNITSSVWQVRLVENEEQLDNVRLARKIKIMGHEYLPEYDYSIWVDGKLKVKNDLREYIEKHRGHEPLLCFNHYVNDCVYQEWEACLALQKDSPEIMEKQMKRYKAEGYPEHNGMLDSAFLVRDLGDARMRQVMETWWSEILHGSRRDQLSFNYSCWKNDFVYDTTDLFIYGNEYVELYGHNS